MLQNPTTQVFVHFRHDELRQTAPFYFDDIEADRELIRSTIARIEGVRSELAPWIYVELLAPSNVEMAVHFWTGATHANVLMVVDRLATALDAAGADTTFPRTVVHVEPMGPIAAAAELAPKSRRRLQRVTSRAPRARAFRAMLRHRSRRLRTAGIEGVLEAIH